MDRDRERTLVDRARSDAAAFGELYDFYLPRIYGFAYRRVQERSVAEDVTATTFQRALEAAIREAVDPRKVEVIELAEGGSIGPGAVDERPLPVTIHATGAI